MQTLNQAYFSKNILTYWLNQYQQCDLLLESDHLSVFIDPNLDPQHQATKLTMDQKQVILLSQNLADSLVIHKDFNWQILNWHNHDQLFYYTEQQRETLKSRPKLYLIRELTENDHKIFATFCERLPKDEFAQRNIQLNHALAYGVFFYHQLVAVASMESCDHHHKIMDLTVITLPNFRQQGHAKRLIRSISQHAILEGYEPQYRCHLNHSIDIALAKSAGLSPLLEKAVILN